MREKQLREPIATWWQIDRYTPAIVPLQVVAFTGSFVTYLSKRWTFDDSQKFAERRERRDDIFPTFAEAKAEMLKRATRDVEASKAELQRRRSFLGQVESISEHGGVAP